MDSYNNYTPLMFKYWENEIINSFYFLSINMI